MQLYNLKYHVTIIVHRSKIVYIKAQGLKILTISLSDAGLSL